MNRFGSDTAHRRPALSALLAAALAACTGSIDEAEETGHLDAASPAQGDTRSDTGPGASAEAGPGGDYGPDAGGVVNGPRDADVAGDAAADAGDAADASPTSACGNASYLLCEDFESAAAGTLPSGWSALTGWGGGSAPEVVSDVRHSGARALRTGVASTGQTRVERSLASLGAAADKHWGRIFYRAKAGLQPPSQGVLHNTLVALRGSDEARVVDTVINTQGAHQFLYNIPDDSFGRGSSYDFHSYDGAWHCAEWYVDAASEAYRFFFDGSEVGALAFSGEAAAHLGGVRAIALGFIGYQVPPAAYDGWFDDLVLATTRVGCE